MKGGGGNDQQPTAQTTHIRPKSVYQMDGVKEWFFTLLWIYRIPIAMMLHYHVIWIDFLIFRSKGLHKLWWNPLHGEGMRWKTYSFEFEMDGFQSIWVILRMLYCIWLFWSMKLGQWYDHASSVINHHKALSLPWKPVHRYWRQQDLFTILGCRFYSLPSFRPSGWQSEYVSPHMSKQIKAVD